MKVQVLRLLVAAEIREHAARPVLARDLVGDAPDDREDLVQQRVTMLTEVDQRRDVRFGNDDDVHRPEGSRVTEGEHVVGFQDDVDGRAATQRFVAVEVRRRAPPPA